MCETLLYTADVDEQEIMKRAGYCSSTALRKYKTTDDEMSAKVLKFSSNTFFPTIAKFTTESAILVFRFEQLILFFLLL